MLIFEDADDALRRTLSVRLPVPARVARDGREAPAVMLPAWTPVRLSGREGVNSLFSYELVLKAAEAEGAFGASVDAIDIELDGWIGREIGCCISISGTDVDHLGAGRRTKKFLRIFLSS